MRAVHQHVHASKTLASPSSETTLRGAFLPHNSKTIFCHCFLPSLGPFPFLSAIFRPEALSSTIRILATFANLIPFVSLRSPFAAIPFRGVTRFFLTCDECLDGRRVMHHPGVRAWVYVAIGVGLCVGL